MKRILFLFLPFLPYLASAQVAKDTVTVLTIADIPAGAIRDTTNITFVQDNAFKKATFDSLYKYTRVKLLAAGAITSAELATALSNETGTGAAVFATNPTITLGAATGLPLSTGVTGQLPVGNGGTGQSTLTANKVLVGNGTSGVLQPTALTWNNSTSRLGIGVNTATPLEQLSVGYGENTEVGFGSAGGGRAYFGTFGPRALPAGIFDAIAISVNRKITTGAFAVDTFAHAEFGAVVQNANSFIYFRAGTTNNAIGTERVRILGNGNFGIGTAAPAVQFHTTGGVRFAGLATSGTSTYTVKADATGNLWYDSSDETYKKNISAIPYGIAAVMQLNPVAYNFVEDDEPDLGFIAQDIYNIIPELTYTAQDGKFGVKYDKLVSVLTKAIQEQQQQIEALKTRITQLENK